MPVPFGRFRTRLSDIRIRRFQAAETEALDAAQSLSQRQLQAFSQSPIPQEPSLQELGLGLSGGPRFGPISPTQPFEAPQQQLQRGAQNLRQFGQSIQGLDPSSLQQLENLAGFSERQGTTPQAVAQQAQVPSIPQGFSPPLVERGAGIELPEERRNRLALLEYYEPIKEQLLAGLERENISLDEFLNKSAEDQVRTIFPGVDPFEAAEAIGFDVFRGREAGLVDGQVVPTGNDEIRFPDFAKRPGAGRLSGFSPRSPVRGIAEGAPQAIANIGQLGLEALELEREAIQPFTKPAFQFAGEQLAETAAGIPGGRVLRAAGVPVPEAPFRGEAGTAASVVGGELALPSNLIPLPVIDPLVARVLGGAVKTGQMVTRSVLTRLGREAAEQAASETLDVPTKVALREFAEATQGAAPEVPTGLPSLADVPTGAASGDIVEPAALRVAGVEEATKAQQARPRIVGGGADPFVTPLRGLGEVASEVVTSDNRLVRGMVGRTGVNSAVLVDNDVGRLLVGFERQRGAAESLTNVAVAASYDVHASRFTGRGPFPIKNGNIAGKRWEDVLSSDALVAKMDDGAQAAARDYQRAIEEVEFLRVQAGLRPRATSGPESITEGWHYVPRQVEGVRGIELRRPSSPNLQRIFDEASEGAQRGIDYTNDPRANLELHIRAAYNEIAQKQLTDSLEPLSITAKDLVPEGTRVRMEKATADWVAAQRARRGLTVPRALEGVEPEAARRLRGNVTAERRQANKVLEAAKVEYDAAKLRYSSALKTARRKEVAPGELFGIEAPEIPIATWRNRFFPREQADALNEALGSFLRPGQTANWLGTGFEVLGNHIRFLSAVGDFAAPVIQGLPLLARFPGRWGKATLRHFQAFADPTVMARHMKDNLAVYQEMASFNVPVGDVEVFAILKEGKGIPIGRVLELLPKGKAARELLQQGGKQTFGRFQASYDTFLGMARVELWKGLKPGWKGSLDDLAAHVRNMTGGLDSRALGVGPTQRGLESTWLAFSPRLLRSTVALTSDLRLGLRSARGREAWRTLSTLAGAITGIYVATGLAQGKSWEEIGTGLNPLEGKKFISHSVNGDWIGAGGQFRAITQLLARSAADPKSLISGDQFENPILSFLAGRGAPGLRIGQAIVEFATGADALPFDTVDSLPSLAAHLAESALPFAVQGKLEGESWPTTGFAMVGARTSPGTPFENIREYVTSQRQGQETPDESILSLAREMANSGDEEAARLVQEFEASGASAGTEGAQRRGALNENTAAVVERTGLRDVAKDAVTGNIEAAAQFGREYDDLRRDRAIISQFQVRGVDFPEPSSELGKLVDEFYDIQPSDIRDPETQAPDFAAFRATRREVLDKIKAKDAGLARTIDQQPIFNPDDDPELAQMERSYLAAKKLDAELNEISPVRGLSAAQFGEIRSFYRDVNRALDETAGAFPDREVSFENAIKQVGRKQNRSESFIKWAVAARQGSNTRDRLANPEFERFIFEHRAELEPFFPELFTRERLRTFGRIEAGAR